MRAIPSPTRATCAWAGYQMLVRGEPFRGKFRNGFDKPEPFTPGKVEKVEFELPDVFHTLPPRPPHHGAGAELVVPADGPESAEVHADPGCQGGGLPEGDAARVPVARGGERAYGAGARWISHSTMRLAAAMVTARGIPSDFSLPA